MHRNASEQEIEKRTEEKRPAPQEASGTTSAVPEHYQVGSPTGGEQEQGRKVICRNSKMQIVVISKRREKHAPGQQ